MASCLPIVVALLVVARSMLLISSLLSFCETLFAKDNEGDSTREEQKSRTQYSGPFVRYYVNLLDNFLR